MATSDRPTLTKEEIIAIQDEIIAEYEKPEFQERLHNALNAAGEDHGKQNKARQHICLPIQGSAIIKYGFEPTRKGVVESFLAMPEEVKADPEVASRVARMSSLVERYAAPTEEWASWPTSGDRLRQTSPISSPGHSPRSAPELHPKSPEELELEKLHDHENHLAWAGVGPGLDSPRDEAPAGRAARSAAEERVLSRHEVVQLQDALIEEYQKEEFQAKLSAALDAAVSQIDKIRARHEVCLPVQGPIIQRYGFAPTLRGVQQTFSALTPDLRRDPEIAARLTTMNLLVHRVDPHDNALRERDAKAIADVNAGHDEYVKRHPAVHVEPAEGRFWKVVGGAHHHGLIVRKGRDLHSPQLEQGHHEARLSTGAIVNEVELVGDRLHYKKVTGDGPNFGWVSVNLHGGALLEPVAEPVDQES